MDGLIPRLSNFKGLYHYLNLHFDLIGQAMSTMRSNMHMQKNLEVTSIKSKCGHDHYFRRPKEDIMNQIG